MLRVRGRAPEVVGQPSGTQRFAGELRGGLRAATDGLAPDARALLPGLVVGDTSRMTPELDEAFKATDLPHLLAVSGANLTIVLALLIGPPGRPSGPNAGAGGPAGLPLRATAVARRGAHPRVRVVCRPDPSVLRAAACGAITLLAIATGRRRSLIPALATAVLAAGAVRPLAGPELRLPALGAGHRALLTLAPRWSAALQRRGVPGRLAEALAAAAAAQAVCAPVVAVLSAHVSLVAVPCNLLAEFAVAPATVLGFAALATAPVAMPVAKAMAWCASWPAGWIADMARAGAALPGGGVDWPGSWTGGALLAWSRRRRARRPEGCCGTPGSVRSAACCCCSSCVQPPPLARVITGWPPPGWRLAMCDVGQGDATVLEAGGGSGCRGRRGTGPRAGRPVPACARRHPDPAARADPLPRRPCGGAARGAARASVGAIETTGSRTPPDQAGSCGGRRRRGAYPVTRAVAGEHRRPGRWSGGCCGRRRRAGRRDREGPNDASVVLLVRTAGLTLLLLGDLEPARSGEMLPAAPGLTPVDVLKVAHHGSAYQDPELLRRLQPRLALISVGAGNTYGHPAPRTLAALRAEGAAVLRTDVDGPIAVAGRR